MAMEHFEVEAGDAEQGGAGGRPLGGLRRSRRRRRRRGEEAGDHELVEVGRQGPHPTATSASIGRCAAAAAPCAARRTLRRRCAAAVVALSIRRLPPLYHGLDYSARSLGDVHSGRACPRTLTLTLTPPSPHPNRNQAGVHWLGLLHRFAGALDAADAAVLGQRLRAALCADLLHARTAEGLVARLHVGVLWRYSPRRGVLTLSLTLPLPLPYPYPYPYP